MALLIATVSPIIVQLVPSSAPPIQILNQRFEWVGPRTLQSTSDGSIWTRTCPLVLTSRGLLMQDGGYVGVSAVVISGPLVGATFDPRYEVTNMTPQKRGASVVQYDIPPWIKDDELDQILSFSFIQRVNADQPCTDGYAGRYESTVSIPKHSSSFPPRGH